MILRLPDVKKIVGLGRSSIYAQVQRGDFPSPVRIGPRATGWRSEEVEEWIKTRKKTSEK